MKKAERKFYTKDKKEYLNFVGSHFVGVFDENNECISETLIFKGDMFKVIINKKIYLLRIYIKKGIGLMFEIIDNDINLTNPKTYMIQTAKYKIDWSLWIEMDESFKCLSDGDKKDV